MTGRNDKAVPHDLGDAPARDPGAAAGRRRWSVSVNLFDPPHEKPHAAHRNLDASTVLDRTLVLVAAERPVDAKGAEAKVRDR